MSFESDFESVTDPDNLSLWQFTSYNTRFIYAIKKYFSSLLQKKEDLPCQNYLKTQDEYKIKHGKGKFDSFISMKELNL
jgi:hypothetical protein